MFGFGYRHKSKIRIKDVSNKEREHLIGKVIEIERFGEYKGHKGAFIIHEGTEMFLPETHYLVHDDYCNHDWIDTGMRITWCKKCDKQAHYRMGHIVEED